MWRSTGNGYTYFTTTGNVNSYVDTSLINGSRYDYAINAVNSSGASSAFSFVSGTPYDPFAPYPYKSFDGYDLTRYLWPGQKVVVLTSSNTLNTNSMGKILTALDTAYNYYSATTGRTPSLLRHIDGKTTIAEAPSTCGGGGAGCGYLGATGIELQTTYFNILYDEVTDNNRYDQVPFYELGRNFWFYGDKIEYKGSDQTGAVTTGFAVYMRSKSMEAANVAGAPLNGFPFNNFKNEIASLVDRYEANPALNWSNTLKIGRAPSNSMNLGGPDLFASFCIRLERDYGGEAFVQKLWKEVEKQPNATTTTAALNNFVRAASAAAGQDLTSLFQNRWRWPLTPTPTPGDDTGTVAEDGVVNIRVLDNDYDYDGDTLNITNVTQGAHGSVSIATTFAGIIYRPEANYNGADSFTYTVNDGQGNTATATVRVTVTPVNDAPTSSTQSVATQEDTAKAIILSASDIDGDTLNYSIVSAPAHGVLTGTAPNLTYSPNSNFNGTDSFSWKAHDGSVDSEVAIVAISVEAVNDAPVSSTQFIVTNEDTSKNITILATDSDGDALTYFIVSAPTNGTLSGSGANRLYTPNANYNGSDSFTFKANDGALDSNVATVSISASPVNDAPTSSGQSETTPQNTAKNITLSASDLDGDALSYVIVAAPTKGTLSGSGANRIYTPNAGFSGADSFTFTANDGALNSNVSTVNISVTPVVVASNYVVTYNITQQRSNGFNATVTIKNNGPAVNGWTLTWTFPGNQRITNASSTRATQSGANVSARDAIRNKRIATGGTATFSFASSYSGTNAKPTSFKLNGVNCTVAP